MEQHYRTCNICEALCGLEITHEGEKIISIKGDKNDPLSKGHICPKAVALQDFYHDEERIRQPLRKTKNGFEPISWDEALDYTADKIKEIQASYGNDSVATFLGNPNSHNFANTLFLRLFLKALKTTSRYSASSVDQLPHHVVALHMLGHTLLNPVPDLDRIDYLLIMGGNPMVSNGSMMSSPDIRGRLRAIQQRGGKVVVIDPRKTETAYKADDHHFIYPETDVYLLLSMIYVLLEEGRVTLGHLEKAVNGLNDIQEMIKDYAPEQVEKITSIPADTIRKIVVDMTNAKTAVLYSRMGLSTQTYGGLCIWLSNVFNILTGNYDKPGGMMFPRPAVDPVSFSPRKGRPIRDIPTSRARKLPKYMGEIPSASMVDEIETEGEGQMKALICIAGNPVLSTPNGRKMEQALEKLELVVCTDIYLTETSRHADIIFPATCGLEIEQYDLSFLNLAIHNVVKYSPPLFSKKGNVKHDWEILAALTERLTDEPNSVNLTPSIMLDMALRQGHYAKDGLTLDKLKDNPHGIDLGPLDACLMDRIQTNESKIELAPKEFLIDLNRLNLAVDKEADSELPLRMIGRRVLRQHNTWTQNAQRLSKGTNDCTLLIHPTDAKRLHIKDKQLVIVKSKVGNLEVPAEITEDMMPGVVCLPQGFGTSKQAKMKVASAQKTVSINDITDHNRIDTLTGNAALNGVHVAVAPTE